MKKLAQHLLDAAQLESELSGGSVSEEYRRMMEKTAAGVFSIVVMGEIKKGKSSFINALLEHRNLVPVASDIATSTVFKISYGERISYRVHFLKESGKEPLEIPAESLSTYGTESGNPGNDKQVDYIKVTCPSPVLQAGVVVVDTPGLGGLYKGHKKITWQYVPRAQAVFFATDSAEAPIGSMEIDNLKEVLKITRNIRFIQTKTSAVDRETREALRDNNLRILRNELGLENPPYFLIDSVRKLEADETENDKKLQRSGFPELLEYLNGTLLPNRHTILARRAIQYAWPTLTHVRETLSTRQNTLNADSREKQEELKKGIEKLQAEDKEWQKKEYPQLTSRIERGLQLIRSDAMDYCSKCRPAGEVQVEMEQMIDNATDMEALKNAIADIQAKLPSYTSAVIQGASNLLRERVTSMLRELAIQAPGSDRTDITLREEGNTGNNLSVNTSALNRVLTLPEATFFETARNSAMGYSIMSGLGANLGFIIGSAIPIIGSIAGAGIGMLIAGVWGGRENYKIQEGHQLRAAKSQAVGALGQAISSSYAEINSAINKIIIEMNSAVKDLLRKAVDEREKDLERQMQDIRNRGKMNSEEQSKQRQELAAYQTRLAAITKGIAPWMSKPSNS